MKQNLLITLFVFSGFSALGQENSESIGDYLEWACERCEDKNYSDAVFHVNEFVVVYDGKVYGFLPIKFKERQWTPYDPETSPAHDCVKQKLLGKRVSDSGGVPQSPGSKRLLYEVTYQIWPAGLGSPPDLPAPVVRPAKGQ